MNKANWTEGSLKNTLSQNKIVYVIFTKKNGEKRNMRCTLHENELPNTFTESKEKQTNPEVCVVWDLDKKAWRSFRYDSIESVTLNEELQMI